jgi:biopolymer transport protein ExbB
MRSGLLVSFSILAILTAGTVLAQSDPMSPDELLRRVQEGRVEDRRLHDEREKAFREARGRQEQLLQEVRRERVTAEQQSERLENEYDANELLISDVTEQLERRMGSLRELLGVLQQVASDSRGLVENSVTNVQIEGRGAFLSELAKKAGSTTTLPSIEDIEQLWYVMQQEMTETGKIVRFPATVITSDGREVEKDVVRVGAFNVVSDGKYLRYIPETGNLSELNRQPQGRYTKTTARAFDVSEGTFNFGLDPTRGQILATYLDRPTLGERIDQGGLIGYIIIALGILGLLIALERLLRLSIYGRKVAEQLKSSTPRTDNPLGRVLKVAEEHSAADVETLELKLGEAVHKEQPRLTRSLLFIKIISVVAPLMGLLGTVTGMIVTFQAITLYGTGDPKLMAGGISQALVTTVLGLTVAIPMVLLHTVVTGRSRHILHVLEEQSAGIVAERSEDQSVARKEA